MKRIELNEEGCSRMRRIPNAISYSGSSVLLFLDACNSKQNARIFLGCWRLIACIGRMSLSRGAEDLND